MSGPSKKPPNPPRIDLTVRSMWGVRITAKQVRMTTRITTAFQSIGVLLRLAWKIIAHRAIGTESHEAMKTY